MLSAINTVRGVNPTNLIVIMILGIFLSFLGVNIQF